MEEFFIEEYNTLLKKKGIKTGINLYSKPSRFWIRFLKCLTIIATISSAICVLLEGFEFGKVISIGLTIEVYIVWEIASIILFVLFAIPLMKIDSKQTTKLADEVGANFDARFKTLENAFFRIYCCNDSSTAKNEKIILPGKIDTLIDIYKKRIDEYEYRKNKKYKLILIVASCLGAIIKISLSEMEELGFTVVSWAEFLLVLLSVSLFVFIVLYLWAEVNPKHKKYVSMLDTLLQYKVYAIEDENKANGVIQAEEYNKAITLFKKNEIEERLRTIFGEDRIVTVKTEGYNLGGEISSNLIKKSKNAWADYCVNMLFPGKNRSEVIKKNLGYSKGEYNFSYVKFATDKSEVVYGIVSGKSSFHKKYSSDVCFYDVESTGDKDAARYMKDHLLKWYDKEILIVKNVDPLSHDEALKNEQVIKKEFNLFS